MVVVVDDVIAVDVFDSFFFFFFALRVAGGQLVFRGGITDEAAGQVADRAH